MPNVLEYPINLSALVPQVPECSRSSSALIPECFKCAHYPSVISGLSAQVAWVQQCPSAYRVHIECRQSAQWDKILDLCLSE